MTPQPGRWVGRGTPEAIGAGVRLGRGLALFAVVAWGGPLSGSEAGSARQFRNEIQPLLAQYCYDCHGDGRHKGNVAFDGFQSDADLLGNPELWWKALKNLRAGIMPPEKQPQPTAAEKERIGQWIKSAVFRIDPRNPDPGRVTLRRLNRVEYRNTIRDLLGVTFDTQTAFPPDDTGHGFDNNGDVLTLPPMLLEKYVLAANQIITEAVPSVARVVRERVVAGRQFRGGAAVTAEDRDGRPGRRGGLPLPYYRPAAVSNTFKADFAGRYQLAVALMINEKYVDNVFDYNQCRLIFRGDGQELLRQDYGWEGGKPYHYNCDVDWAAGDHELSFELQPLTPNEPQTRTLSLQITSVTVSGPMAQEHWVAPKDYARFFPRPVPDDAKGRRAYARELLRGFARRAFRRPPDPLTLDRLVGLAESVYRQPGKTFEGGVAQAMVAVLASPSFLFREERAEKSPGGPAYPYVDEFSLAARLSYFLWSSMPDDELLRLAEAGRLRRNLAAQVDRLLQDKRSDALVQDFVGQWLRTRDIENIPLEARFVLAREEKFDPAAARDRQRLQELKAKAAESLTPAEQEELTRLRGASRRASAQPLRAEMNAELRLAMRRETEKSFDYLLREDRSLLELLDCDYTFLNERLAQHYGIPNVRGDELRLVKLPADSPRGGILTQGNFLGVTSNPTRTSPVKRGVFILDNLLGTPSAAPPPNIPPLEDAAKGLTNRAPSLRETLAVHRQNPLCSSCHNRMDPLGLALENFNALGMWRDQEFEQPIDPTGKLISGETFANVRELKQALARNHARDFYRTVTEKLLIYALGRGLEYYDVETSDRIVARIEAAHGRPSALIAGVVESAPFQKTRPADHGERRKAMPAVPPRADAGTKP